MSVMNEWLNIIRSNDNDLKLATRLSSIYLTNLPVLAGLITTGICYNSCLHCIYSEDFSKYNRNICFDKWTKIVDSVYEDLNIRTFVHNGRMLDEIGVELFKYLRREKKDCQIGLILDGSNTDNRIEDLNSISPDWIDISVEGLEQVHDIQRSRIGSFKAAEQTALKILDSNITEKINLLSCLTTINNKSMLPMFELMNKRGFKNFFISPVSLLEGYRPSPNLVLSLSEFCSFITDIIGSIEKLNDTWIELNLFDVHYFNYSLEGLPSVASQLIVEDECLSYQLKLNDNELFIKYYPLSLVGIREFVVNCNGNVILPKMMAKGKISEGDVFGSMLTSNAGTIFSQFTLNSSFSFYLQALLEERKVLNGMLSL